MTTEIDLNEEAPPPPAEEKEIEGSALRIIDGANDSYSQAVEGAVAASTETVAMLVDDDDEVKKRKTVEDTTSYSDTLENSDPRPPGKRFAPARVPWEDRVSALRAYKAEHGDLNIPIRYKANPSLGKFVHNTREQYKLFHNKCKPGYQKRCSLTAERIAELDALGFLWTTERVKRQNEEWAIRMEQLKEYKSKHGDCMVPHGYYADPSFAEWIHRQRTTYASISKETEPKNAMVQDRMVKLEEMGFNFTVHSDKWMDHWQLLRDYKEKHGNCQVPTHYAENPKLGRWTHTQRHQRRLQVKGKKSCITAGRIELLDQLGFSWEVRPAMEQPRATWQQRHDELKEFHIENDHFLIPAETHPKLHLWSHEQRTRLKNLEASGKDASRRMGPDRVSALQVLGFTKETILAELQAIDDDRNESATAPGAKEPEPEDRLAEATASETTGAAADNDAATLLAVNEAAEAAVSAGMEAAGVSEAVDTTFPTEAV